MKKLTVILATMTITLCTMFVVSGIAKADSYSLAAISPNSGTFTNLGGTFSFTDNNVDFIDNTVTSADFGNSDYLDLSITGSDTLVAPGTFTVSDATATYTPGNYSFFDTLITPIPDPLISSGTGTLGNTGGAASVSIVDSAGGQLSFGPTNIVAGTYNTAGGSFTPAPEADNLVAFGCTLLAGGFLFFVSKKRRASYIA
jgi:hypothetical protein